MTAPIARWIVPLVALGIGLAAATVGSSHAEIATPAETGDRACRTFPITVDDGQGGAFLTSDRTGPVGEWVGAREDEGWRMDVVDYEIGQRSTGYPEHRVMVCVRR